MKKIISGWIIAILMLVVFVGLVTPAVSDGGNSGGSNSRTREWSSYKAYYNQTFNIDQSWEADKVSVAVFVQTDDEISKDKDPQGSTSTPKFTSSEVMQSTIDFLDGSKTTTGTSRNVLGELFTATWCGFCPGGVGAFDRLTRDPTYFPAKTTLVEVHASGDHGNTDGAARQSQYDVGGIPSAVFDGYECYTGGSSDPNSSTPESHYKRIINARQPTQSIIDITTFGQKTSKDGWINASVELLSPTKLRNLKVHFFILEDIYPANNSGAFYRHTLQKWLSPQDFTPLNHAPKIKSSISPVSIPEDNPGTMGIRLRDHFEDDDLDELTYHSNREGENKGNITVAIDDMGNVTLTPDADWNGQEEIAFYSNDGMEDSPSTKVIVTITAVNDAPIVANPIVDFSMHEDILVDDKINLTHVFYDVDTDTSLNPNPQAPLTYSYSGSENIQVTIKSDGWVVLDPIPDWNGNETLTFIATDSGNEYVTDNVKIWVKSFNDPPTLKTALVPLTIDEDKEMNDFLDLNDYFSDTDGDTLNYDFDKSTNFTIKLKGSLISLTPKANWWGTDKLTFYATDIPGSEPVPATLDVTVNSVNDAPILYALDQWTIKTHGLKYTQSTIEMYQDQDIEIIVKADDVADNDELLFTDNTDLFDIDSTTGEIKFTPTNSDVGIYTVNITVNDQQSKNNLAFSEFYFKVINMNDPPETPVITSPEDQKTYITDSEIEFKASADDPDLHLEDSKERLSYEWTTNKTTDVLSVSNEFETKLAPGVYEITVTVTDRDKKSSSSSVGITVDINREKDLDSDGIPDYLDDDIDGDGMPNSWEKQYSLNPEDPSDATKDPDRDSFSNLDEYLGDDGIAGGDDSTNPKIGSSKPKIESDTDDSGGLNMFMVMAIIAVVVIIAILLVLFMMMRKRKKGSEQKPSPTPMPTQESTPQVPQPPLMPMPPTMQGPYGETELQQQMMLLQQPPMGGDLYGEQPMPMQMPMYPLQQPQVPEPQTTTTELPIPDDTPRLPEVDEPELTTPPAHEPEIEPAQEPEPTEEPTKEPVEEPITDESSEPTVESTGATCPHCNEPIKDGWMMCPNCKEII